MPVYRDSAVVLRVTKLGEADRIVTLLTRREGRVRAVAKGVRRTKSRFGGRLEPFSHVDLQLYAGRNLDIVTQAETLDPFGPVLVADYPRYTCATAIVETAERLTVGGAGAVAAAVPAGGVGAAGADRDRPGPVAGAGRVPAAGDGAGRLGAGADRVRPLRRPRPARRLPRRRPAACSARTAAAPGRSARPGRRRRRSTLMAALAGGDWAAADGADGQPAREASGLVAALLQWHLERGLRSLPLVDRRRRRSVGDRPTVDAVSGRRRPRRSTVIGA